MRNFTKYSCIFLIVFLCSCKTKNEQILPTKRDLIESVYTSVIVQPDSLYQVFSAVSGILETNMVEEGDLVSSQMPIAQIINNAPKLNTQNAKLALALAQENYAGSAAILRGIEDEIEAARLKFKNDSINYFRQKSLWEQHIGSKAEFDTKKLSYELSQNDLNLLKSKLKRTKNELKTSLLQAENNYKTSIINTTDFTVKSAMKGKLYALYKEPGEIVTSREPIASIGSAGNFIVEMLVDEVDIVKIVIGQEVVISLDAYNSEIFTGKVSKIFPKKDERNQTFKVEAFFDERPKVLYPGLSGEANIIISKKDNILTIPKEYLLDGDKVVTDNDTVSVIIGSQSLEYVEILSGIKENTYIYRPSK